MKKPKIAFVTMRYGAEVVGGAEAFCKIIAERMSRYWDITVLTTDSVDHFTWEPKFKTGTTEENNVTIKRFSIDEKKNLAHLGELGQKLMAGKFRSEDELDWINTQGPISKPMFDYIKENEDNYDAFFFWGYLFAHTYYGIQLVPKKAVLVPFIHDEAFFYFRVYDKEFGSAKAIVFETPEEEDLLYKVRPHSTKKTEIIGTAIDIPKDLSTIKLDKKYIVNDPYIVFVGRVEPAKGVNELVNNFLKYKQDNPGKLKLVLVGNRNNELPESDDIIHLGPVFGDQKFVIMSRAQVLINPSPWESFSLVIAESWLSGTPTLVNGQCAVLKGQSDRSNAGLWYNNYQEFEKMLTILLDNPSLQKKMAENGKKYIMANYTWPIVEAKYKEMVKKVIGK